MIYANKTYLGKTAGGYIKSCKAVRFSAGYWEVVCEDLGGAVVCFDKDHNFWTIYEYGSSSCRLTMSNKARRDLEKLLSYCAQQIKMRN